jgi:hypothetical protein
MAKAALGTRDKLADSGTVDGAVPQPFDLQGCLLQDRLLKGRLLQGRLLQGRLLQSRLVQGSLI